MSPVATATATRPDAPTPPAAPAVDMAALAALIQDATAGLREEMRAVREDNERLRGDLERAKQQTPRIQAAVTEDRHNVEARRAAFAAAGRDTPNEGGRQIPVDAHGRRIPDFLLDEYGPKYAPGARVRIRREVTREGCPHPFGQLLDRVKSDGEGVVLRQQFLTKVAEWKYTVRVDRLTRRTGDGFYAHELEPA